MLEHVFVDLIRFTIRGICVIHGSPVQAFGASMNLFAVDRSTFISVSASAGGLLSPMPSLAVV